MKSLKMLIKIHKHELDILRRQMTVLTSERASLEQSLMRLQNELVDEAAKASESHDLARYFGSFADRNKKRQQQVREEIVKVEEKIDALSGKIAEAFSELKKFEIALKNAQQREKEELNRKENIAMGDLAIQQFQRHKENNEN